MSLLYDPSNDSHDKSYVKLKQMTDEDSKQKVLIKIYRFDKYPGKVALNEFKAEVNFYERVKHPFIMKPLSFTIDNKIGKIKLPFCPEGDLYTAIFITNIKITQEIIIKFAYNLLSAVKEMHSKNVIHKDLKLENILIKKFNYESRSNRKQLDPNGFYIIDGGSEGTCMYYPPEYRAFPKILSKKYDIWTVGVILYLMIFKRYPYDISKNYEIEFEEKFFENSISENYSMIVPLIKNFLSIEYRERMTAKDSLRERIFQAERMFQAEISD